MMKNEDKKDSFSMTIEFPNLNEQPNNRHYKEKHIEIISTLLDHFNLSANFS